MSILNNRRLAVKVCELYYYAGLSQKEICAKLGISRPQISRILKEARTSGLITITINNPFGNETALELALIEKYNLADALVFDTGELDEEEALVEFAKQAADQLDVYLPAKGSVGIMSGRTIAQLIKQVRRTAKRELEFVPLIGGMGSDGADWHANIIAKALADKTGGHYYMLHAPVLVKNEAAKEVLLNEPGIAMVLEKGGRCDVTILGIGQVNEKSASVVAGSLTVAEVEALRQAGAVASICGSYVAQSGAIVENDVTKRMIGQTLETIRSSKKVAVAVGADRADAIKAVLSGKHIDVLITNADAARKILEIDRRRA